MKIENTYVFGWEAAIHGMRNPLESWAKSDSIISADNRNFIMGFNDLDLAQRLKKSGTEHAKYLRMIHVQFDLTAPMYVFSEIDTYKVATVANSTSKMHKIQSKPITIEYFETDDMDDLEKFILNRTINDCESYRQLYNETKDKRYWKALIRLLPESWLQMRTMDMNYETLSNIYHQRSGHKLTEWKYILNWIETLPYAKQLIIGEENE